MRLIISLVECGTDFSWQSSYPTQKPRVFYGPEFSISGMFYLLTDPVEILSFVKQWPWRYR